MCAHMLGEFKSPMHGPREHEADVGVATAFLAHDAARLITGETLYIDGGYHIID